MPDNAVSELIKEEYILIANYRADNDKEKKNIELKIINLQKQDKFENTTLNIDTKLRIKENSICLGAMVTFIGLYLGIIFLISCAAILALKELSESSDNIENLTC